MSRRNEMAKDDLVVDVETVAPEWDELDEPTRGYLAERSLRQLQRDGLDAEAAGLLAKPRAAERLALEHGLARVAAIGICNVRTGDVAVILEQRGDAKPAELDRPRIYTGTEDVVLRRWWDWAPKYGRIVGFNVRGYDGPVLHIRSAQLGVGCTRELVPYRYSFEHVCDLAEALNFMGGVRTGYTLDWWCRRFDIESPKAEGVDGSEVAGLYRAGRMMDIARYLARDLRATRELYLRLRSSYLHLFRDGPPLTPAQEPLLRVEGA